MNFFIALNCQHCTSMYMYVSWSHDCVMQYVEDACNQPLNSKFVMPRITRAKPFQASCFYIHHLKLQNEPRPPLYSQLSQIPICGIRTMDWLWISPFKISDLSKQWVKYLIIHCDIALSFNACTRVMMYNSHIAFLLVYTDGTFAAYD